MCLLCVARILPNNDFSLQNNGFSQHNNGFSQHSYQAGADLEFAGHVRRPHPAETLRAQKS